MPQRHRTRTRTNPNAIWLSPKEAAAHLGVGIKLIYAACASGGLRHSKLGHTTIRIKREWLDAWAEERATAA